MISHRVANMIILGVSVAMALVVFAILVYVALTQELENHLDIVIGSTIGFIMSVGLCLYIWRNHNKKEC